MAGMLLVACIKPHLFGLTVNLMIWIEWWGRFRTNRNELDFLTCHHFETKMEGTLLSEESFASNDARIKQVTSKRL